PRGRCAAAQTSQPLPHSVRPGMGSESNVPALPLCRVASRGAYPLRSLVPERFRGGFAPSAPPLGGLSRAGVPADPTLPARPPDRGARPASAGAAAGAAGGEFVADPAFGLGLAVGGRRLGLRAT